MIVEKRRMVFLLLDAFRGDYINAVDSPFLYEKTQQGTFVEALRTTPGFTQRTCIFTGSMGDVTGRFTHFTFDPEGSPFRFLRGDRRLSRFSRGRRWWRRLPSAGYLALAKRALDKDFARRQAVLRRQIRKEAEQSAFHAPVAHIPLELLPYIGVSEDAKAPHLPGGFDQESIFDVLVSEGIPYEYAMYPVVNVDDFGVQETLLRRRDAGAAVFFAQFSDSDARIHECGPASPLRRQVVGEIDRKVRELADAFGPDTTFVLVGDHGMTDVTDEVDVPAAIAPAARRLGARLGRDYLMFLDSTMARFRSVTPAGEALLRELPSISPLAAKGRFLDEKLAAAACIPFPDRRYGDVIWCANVGVLLFPDYFHDERTRNKGMHGYDSQHPDMKGCLVAFGPRVPRKRIPQASLVDVCPTLCAALGVRPPSSSTGVALL